MSEYRTWADVERTLANLPRTAVAIFASRAARRSLSAIAKLEAKYGPEAQEWFSAIDAVLGVVERFAGGAPVSRFTLDLAADVARSTANATANAARTLGPSPLVEDAELAYAAAAFAADAARATSDTRAASMAMQSARATASGGAVPAEQAADLRALVNGEALEALPAERVERADLYKLFVAPGD
jgi:hypothetical protein